MDTYATIRRIHVVLPGLTARRWLNGGFLIAGRLATLLDAHVPTDVITSVDREEGVPFLDDILATPDAGDVFLITWGPHVRDLLAKLADRRVVYYAQSTGWGSTVPTTVPVVCLSRFIMASWMREAPHNALFFLGPVLEDDCIDNGVARDIDVLFLERKSTAYLKERLVPALREQCVVHTVRDFIPRSELFRLYNRSRVYLYSSAPWRSGWVEGFGLQPLEAIVCGCAVFSNLHGGLSDYLEPEMNGFKLEVHSLGFDVSRILRAVAEGAPQTAQEIATLRDVYSVQSFHRRAQRILHSLDALFTHMAGHPPDIAAVADPPAPSVWTRAVTRARTGLRRSTGSAATARRS
jgi:hypothetical protein